MRNEVFGIFSKYFFAKIKRNLSSNLLLLGHSSISNSWRLYIFFREWNAFCKNFANFLKLMHLLKKRKGRKSGVVFFKAFLSAPFIQFWFEFEVWSKYFILEFFLQSKKCFNFSGKTVSYNQIAIERYYVKDIWNMQTTFNEGMSQNSTISNSPLIFLYFMHYEKYRINDQSLKFATRNVYLTK